MRRRNDVDRLLADDRQGICRETRTNGRDLARVDREAPTEAAARLACDRDPACNLVRAARRIPGRGDHRLQEVLLESGGVLSQRAGFPLERPAGSCRFHADPRVAARVLLLASAEAGPPAGMSWLLATLAIWGALLRMPMYGACSLLLAAGSAG